MSRHIDNTHKHVDAVKSMFSKAHVSPTHVNPVNSVNKISPPWKLHFQLLCSFTMRMPKVHSHYESNLFIWIIFYHWWRGCGTGPVIYVIYGTFKKLYSHKHYRATHKRTQTHTQVSSRTRLADGPLEMVVMTRTEAPRDLSCPIFLVLPDLPVSFSVSLIKLPPLLSLFFLCLFILLSLIRSSWIHFYPHCYIWISLYLDCIHSSLVLDAEGICFHYGKEVIRDGGLYRGSTAVGFSLSKAAL